MKRRRAVRWTVIGAAAMLIGYIALGVGQELQERREVARIRRPPDGRLGPRARATFERHREAEARWMTIDRADGVRHTWPVATPEEWAAFWADMREER